MWFHVTHINNISGTYYILEIPNINEKYIILLSDFKFISNIKPFKMRNFKSTYEWGREAICLSFGKNRMVSLGLNQKHLKEYAEKKKVNLKSENLLKPEGNKRNWFPKDQ